MSILQKAARERARIERFNTVERSTLKEAELKLREINIKLGKKVGIGTNVEIYLADGFEKLYGRKNICLKIFTKSKTVWGYKGKYGQSAIIESTIIQNLMAKRGLAPRVYDTVKINGKTAQVTDYLQGDNIPRTFTDNRFNFVEREKRAKNNWLDGKFIDFQGVTFVDFPAYKKSVIEKAKLKTSFPRTEKRLYQSTKYHGAKRKTEERLNRYKFADFKGKKVLDIGCNLGMMMREAYDQGAKRVIGIDWPDMVEVSEELAILDGYFNLDFIGGDIQKITWEKIQELAGIEKFDTHLFLAMEMWVGWPDWVKNCETLYYEGHGIERPYKVFHNPKGEGK